MKHQSDEQMDANKYDLVFDIIDHPEKYSADRLSEILSDSETREIYTLICKTDSAIEANKPVNVDAEWELFSQTHTVSRRRHAFAWFGSRAASIAAIICTSIAAVAAGIAATVVVIEFKSAPAETDRGQNLTAPNATLSASTTIPTDTAGVDPTPIMFENDSLENIMEAIGRTYNVAVSFDSKEVAALHLYYKLDPALTLDEIVSQLNTFKQIHICQEADTLYISEPDTNL